MRSTLIRCVGARFERLTLLGLYFPVMEAKRPVFAFLKALPRKYLQKESLIFGDLNTGCRQSEVSLLPEGNEFYDAVTGGPIGAEPKIEGHWVYLYRAADKAGRTWIFA